MAQAQLRHGAEKMMVGRRPAAFTTHRSPETTHSKSATRRTAKGRCIRSHGMCAGLPRPQLHVYDRRTACCAIAGAEEDTAFTTSDIEISAHSEEAREFAVAMAKVADDTKAQDLLVLHVEPVISWTSYMLICTVLSRPQLLAVMGRIEKAAEEDWGRSKQNSPGSSPWEVMDFGDVVIHVFTPEQREYYDVESFYATAEEVDLPFLDGRPTPEGSGSEGGETNSTINSMSTAPSWSTQL